jgi:hypothetical protein
MGCLVTNSLRERLSSRLRLKRLVTRRNGAVIKYRKLAKAAAALKSSDLEREISEQLAMIEHLNAEIERLRGEPRSWARGNVVEAQSRSMQTGPHSKKLD